MHMVASAQHFPRTNAVIRATDCLTRGSQCRASAGLAAVPIEIHDGQRLSVGTRNQIVQMV